MTRSEQPLGEIILVRHGESTWNVSKRVQGQCDDARLTARGQRQAREAAESLSGSTYDAIFSSDLSRALETAAIIAEVLGLEVRITSDLRERGFGEIEGAPLEELTPELSGIADGRIVDASASPVDGETLDELFTRISRFMATILTRHRGETVIVVAHGGTIRAIRAYLQRLPMSGLQWDAVTNCSIWPFDMAPD